MELCIPAGDVPQLAGNIYIIAWTIHIVCWRADRRVEKRRARVLCQELYASRFGLISITQKPWVDGVVQYCVATQWIRTPHAQAAKKPTLKNHSSPIKTLLSGTTMPTL